MDALRLAATSSLRYAARYGHASALAMSYADEIRIMVEHIQKWPANSSWAYERIFLACTALANVEASSEAAADRVLGGKAEGRP
jgi:hypothetical protein